MVVDDADVPRSMVEVTVDTRSIEMLDAQQTSMLRDAEFFDEEHRRHRDEQVRRDEIAYEGHGRGQHIASVAAIT